MESKDKVLISYNKIYTLDQKLYSVGNIKLPQPVQMHTAIAFLITVIVVFIVTAMIPIPIPGAIKYLVIPYLLAKKITVSRRDGKSLYKYYIGYIPFLLEKKIEIERFNECEKVKKIQFFR